VITWRIPTRWALTVDISGSTGARPPPFNHFKRTSSRRPAALPASECARRPVGSRQQRSGFLGYYPLSRNFNYVRPTTGRSVRLNQSIRSARRNFTRTGACARTSNGKQAQRSQQKLTGPRRGQASRSDRRLLFRRPRCPSRGELSIARRHTRTDLLNNPEARAQRAGAARLGRRKRCRRNSATARARNSSSGQFHARRR